MINFLFGKYIRKQVEEEVATAIYEMNLEVEHQVKVHCVELVKSLFSEDAPHEQYVRLGFGEGFFGSTARGEFEKGIAKIVTKNMVDNENERIKERLSGEELIDGIVKRILDKQIK